MSLLLRLPTDVVPSNYQLLLKPDLKTFTFSAELKIKVYVNKPTDVIILNAVDLVFNQIIFTIAEGAIMVPDISFQKEFLILKFDDIIESKSGTLSFIYTGSINNNMRGFYRSKCTTTNGRECYAGITQFESTDARRAFPCFDEPSFKSTFDITIEAPSQFVVLSNMPTQSMTSLKDSNLHSYVFQTTPVMSTYLVAWVIGEFHYIEDSTLEKVKVRVYTPLNKGEQGQFALKVAVKALKFLENFFQIPYPLPKIDLIAIPDFACGAMENWGLITYREICLLIDPKNSSSLCKQLVAIVVSHELAHQWFGNLVTMKWWTDLWLKEGFAQFMEYQCVDHMFPEFKIWDQFVIKTHGTALELDSLKSSHPIEVPIESAEEIEEIYDDISYNKGASLIRMLHSYLGNEEFRQGLTLYLNKHQYKATETNDLWSALEETSQKPVANVMKTWTQQIGFPVINVALNTKESSTKIDISQNQFCSSQSDKSLLWMVPITIFKGVNNQTLWKSLLLDSKSVQIECEELGEQYIQLNPGRIGYYRVNYDPQLIHKFLPSIQRKTIASIDRLSIQSDLYAMVKAGYIRTSKLFELLSFYRDEEDYTVWGSIINSIHEVYNILCHTQYLDQFISYVRHILEIIHQKLGWEPKPDESHTSGLLRNLVLETLVFFGDEEVLKIAGEKFQRHLSGEAIIPPDLRLAIYKAQAMLNIENISETMIDLYKKNELQEEKLRISMALGLFKDTEILKNILNFSLSDDVKSQDFAFLISSVSQTLSGRELAWEFFTENFQRITTKLSGNTSLLSRTIKAILENFALSTWADKAEVFFKDNPISGVSKTIDQSIETVRINSNWLQRDMDDIEQIFNSPEIYKK